MGKYATRALVANLECTDYAGSTSLAAQCVDEFHAVEGERGGVIPHHDALLPPLGEQLGSLVVAVALVTDGHVHVDDVLRMVDSESFTILLAQDVIWRGAHVGEGQRWRVAQGVEGFKTRHNDSVPSSTPVLLDVDGVVWLMQKPLPGAVEAIRRLEEAGVPFAFVTNNSYRPASDQEQALEAVGINARGRVLTSSMAAAEVVLGGSRVLVGGGPGVVDALAKKSDAEIVLVEDRPTGQFDHVVVGFHRHFDFEGLHILSRAIRSGANFVATNDDATYPTPDGPIPGGGSIVAAVATASGRQPVIAGKPHEPMARLVRRHFPDVDVSSAWMVGDRLSTDGAFARLLGCRFARVRSNVSELQGDVPVTLERDSLADVVDEILAG